MALAQQGVPGVLDISKQARAEALLQTAVHKAALRFVPLLTIAYLFNYLDRTSLGFAALTMNQQLGLTASQFGLAAGAFFLGYSVFEIPSNLLLYRFGARRWIARIMISWGLVSAATAFVVGPNSFYTLRLLLGIAEAGFFPGVTFFLAAWFPAQYRTRMLAWFLIGIPLSSLVGAPVCGMLLQMDGIWGLAGWQWLFLLVSLPCIPLGLLTLKLLADRPQVAHWLTAGERDALIDVLASEVRERPHSSLLAALKDPRVLICTAIQFGFTLGSYGIGIWLPLMLKEYHLSNLAIGWIAAIPYLFASLGMILWAHHVDRKGNRIVNLALMPAWRHRAARADRFRLCWARRHRVQRSPRRSNRGTRDLLDHPDAIPHRRRRGGRACLHQLNRHRGRLRRPIDDGLVEGIFRHIRRRTTCGGRHHACSDSGLDVAEIFHHEGVNPCGPAYPMERPRGAFRGRRK
jgi:MFS family permease